MKTASSTWILGSLLLSLTTAATVRAQIVPDNTLPNASRVEAGCTVCTIDGGTVQGNHLFHSFREFSVPTGGEASFNNAAQVQNIFTRITGSSISNIDGLLRTNGTANLFLINPNGIIFSANAQLNIGGSFVASTADAIAFPNGETFSASNPTQPSALLTINPNALLFNRFNPQPIRSTANSTGLSVNDDRSLLLVGGDVRLEGGQLTAPGGRIELGGLSEPGAIGLTMKGNISSLEFPANAARADVSLVNGSLINVAASDSGSVAIIARNLTILDDSLISAGIDTGLGSVNSQAGNIDINTTGAISIVNSEIFNDVSTESIGRGGNVRIATESLSLTNGSQLSASTFGQGDAGDIFINARDTVSFDGTTPDGSFSSGTFSTVAASGIGQGGNTYITTGSLSLTNSAQLVASVRGRGNAGNIFITARDTVSFDGTTPDGSFSTGAFSSVRGIGRGGNIRIATWSLSLTNGAQLVTSTFGQGDAGNIFVDARISIFDGRSRNDEFRSGAFSAVNRAAIGKGGDITLITGNSLAITNGATLNASSLGIGGAGSIRVNVPFLRLDQASITSGTASGNGGNITLTSQEILLRRGSSISTTAGNAQAGGNGGNIMINGGFMVAVPSENSNITANAFTGRGGRVDITAQGLFGIEFRPRLTPLSDITASSELGIAGVVAINTSDTDLNRGLVDLPTDIIDASRLVAVGCSPEVATQRNRGEFYQTGRGGIAPLPIDPVGSNDILEDLQLPQSWNVAAQANTLISAERNSAGIVEAQSWQRNKRGEVVLVATPTQRWRCGR